MPELKEIFDQVYASKDTAISMSPQQAKAFHMIRHCRSAIRERIRWFVLSAELQRFPTIPVVIGIVPSVSWLCRRVGFKLS